MRLSTLASLSAIMLMIAMTIAVLPEAIEREMAFNDNVRHARCQRHWVQAYCKDMDDRDYLTQLTEARP